MAQMNMKEAIRDAMRVELTRDPNVLIFGEDVGNVGGVFRVTEGLQKEFGEERVRYTAGRVCHWRFGFRSWRAGLPPDR